MARGRKFSSGELQLLLLALLGDEPRHGYRLMKQIEARSNGGYRPSAGVVYPALTHLEQAGYVQAVVAGKRRTYTLTEAGRGEAEATQATVHRLWAKLDFLGQQMALVRRTLADEQAWSERDTHSVAQTVMAAFEALKISALVGDGGSPLAQRRIVAILERASQEIAAAMRADGGKP